MLKPVIEGTLVLCGPADRDGGMSSEQGALLGRLGDALHRVGRALPTGCGVTVGIAGLTLGGGLGLLGRGHGLTCDQLVGARVVLASGRVVECTHVRSRTSSGRSAWPGEVSSAWSPRSFSRHWSSRA